MPKINSFHPVDAYIGFILDGVMSYRNLSSSPRKFGIFRIYPKPEFEQKVTKEIVESDRKFLILKVCPY